MFSEKGRQLPDRVLLEQFELVLERSRALVQAREFFVEFLQGEFRRKEARKESRAA